MVAFVLLLESLKWLLENIRRVLEHRSALFEDGGCLLELLTDLLEVRTFISTFFYLLEQCRTILEVFEMHCIETISSLSS